MWNHIGWHPSGTTMFHRMYHVSSAALSIKKQGLKLSKLLNPKQKKHWYPSNMFDVDTLPSLKSLTKVEKEPGKRGVRRMAMLNKMFMKQITDLMSTGTSSMDIVGRGIVISKVNVSTDFKAVNVFWVCKGNASDVETEQLLNKTAGSLRHELSTLRVMGEVPYITFVKDKQEAKLVDLDRRLAIADYGEDYTPTDIGHLLKSEFTLESKLSSEMKAKIKKLEDELEEELELEENTIIPEMTHTVYGLDHAKILNRLQTACKKSKDAWVNLDMETPVISYRPPPQVIQVDAVKQKKELADFLLKRKIEQKKMHKHSCKVEDHHSEVVDDHEDLGEDDDGMEDEYDYSSEDVYYTPYKAEQHKPEINP